MDDPVCRAGTNASNIYESNKCCVIAKYFLNIIEKNINWITSEKLN